MLLHTIAATLDRALPPLVGPAGATPGTREALATRDPLRFLLLLGQLALLVLVFRAFRVEEQRFMHLTAMIFSAFAVHYWLPFRYKELFWIAVSFAGAFVLLDTRSAATLIGIGLLFYAVAASPVGFPWKVVIALVIGGVLTYGRATLGLGVPTQLWPILGAVFMFRLLVYFYDLQHAKERPSLKEYCTYFFMLPNYYFILFPVIDFQTLRKTYFRRDIHVVAQQGIDWILRGTVQLLLYRAIYHLKPSLNEPESITSFGLLVTAMVGTYLLYLRVSGHFHIIIGFLHLFGYDLPETHRRYLLAHSLTDFWRRINIYWKDFMVKLVYFPVYFRLRRSGEVRAQVVATALVFVATWALHSYQWFWLRGTWLFTWPDTLFWAILGGLVIVNVLMERRQRTPARVSGLGAWTQRGLQIAATFTLMTVLWSLWNAHSVEEWIEVLTWWQVG